MGVAAPTERARSKWGLTAAHPTLWPCASTSAVLRRAGATSSRKKETLSREGIQPEQSLELAAWAARSWVDPRWSLELSGRANARERSCLDRGQTRHRTEVR